MNVLKFSLMFIAILQFLRQIAQMIMLGWNYFEVHEAYENLWRGIKYILILLMLWLPYDHHNICHINRGIAAFTLVASWHEFFLELSKHPHLFVLRRSLAMFAKVSFTFSRYFITYAYLGISFACGFYFIMHQDYSIPTEGNKAYYYNTQWSSIFKVSKICALKNRNSSC